MNPAEKARDNALCFECKKDGLQQRQSGDWVLRFTVQAIDMHQTILSAAMGTRFQCVLVELNDDETPVDHKAKERDKWRDLGPVKQAALRCKEPVFWAFLCEKGATDDDPECYDVDSEKVAAVVVRTICGVSSRSELSKPGMSQARIKWYDLDNAFQAWKVKENA
jgi:hypothetical protein